MDPRIKGVIRRPRIVKNENVQIKDYDIFPISAQNRDCGGSNEYPQSMVLSRNKKTNVYPCKPQF